MYRALSSFHTNPASYLIINQINTWHHARKSIYYIIRIISFNSVSMDIIDIFNKQWHRLTYERRLPWTYCIRFSSIPWKVSHVVFQLLIQSFVTEPNTSIARLYSCSAAFTIFLPSSISSLTYIHTLLFYPFNFVS